ncbi:MAG: PHP domain-containing protein [Candidatus Magasanikbacteria bacterium]|nr:PHP domain-containing protein [Candidatus Magasanikbacteria bacterium]
MLIDLHTHSTFSDGLLTVDQLIKLAKKKRVKLLGLTDHDTVDGLETFRKKSGLVGIKTVRGMELSTDFNGVELHILGYGVNPRTKILKNYLEFQQKKRLERAKKVIARLQKIGFALKAEIIRHLLRQPAVGKPQLGRAILKERQNRILLKRLFGFAGSLADFIAKFLDQPGQIGYVHKKKADSVSAIRLIQKSRGRAVLAHPDIDLSSPRLARKIIPRLAKNGLWGLEMPRTFPTRKKYLLPLAKKYNLVITYGSDTHDGKRLGVKVKEKEGKKLMGFWK